MPMRMSDYVNSFSYHTDPQRLSNWTERLQKARPHLFDFEYPIYDDPLSPLRKEEIKEQIELGILRRYYKREIGSSGGTITDFKHDLEEWLTRRMSYYNEILFTLSLEYDILDNVHMKETYKRNVNDILNEEGNRNETVKNDRTTNSKANNKIDRKADTIEGTEQVKNGMFNGVEFDTPQGMINVDDMNFKHASGASTTKDSEDSTTNTNVNTVGNETGSTDIETLDNTDIVRNGGNQKEQTKSKDEKYTLERKGKVGVTSYPDLVAKFRRNIVNVVEDIVLEADNLFYQLYD